MTSSRFDSGSTSKTLNLSLLRFNKRSGSENFAHNNAKRARCVSELTVWIEDVSPHLSAAIQADSAIS